MFRLKSPLIVQMEITNMCNNRCTFCYNEDVCFKGEMVSIENAYKIIDILKKEEVFEIIISGGECLLHKDICNIIKYITLNNIECSIITNGSLLEESVDELYAAGLRNLQVSLLSSNETIHDNITRNRGSHKKAVAGIQKALNAGMIVSVNVPLLKGTINDLEHLIRLCINLGCQSFTFSRYIGYDVTDTAAPNSQDIANALALLLKYRDIIPTKALNCIPICSLEDKCNLNELIAKNIISKCDGGKIWCSISPKGELYFCPSVRKSLGNILENMSITNIWHNNPFFNDINDDSFIQSKCINCKYFQICGGGCKAFCVIEDNVLKITDPLIRGV